MRSKLHLRAAVVMASFSLQLFAGCSADISTGARPGSTPSPYDPGPGGGDSGGNGNNNGNGTGGPSNGMSCPPGEHWGGQACIADEVTCAAEFPCPDNQQCVGGRCISAPGPCMTNDNCPTGDICVNGMCQPQCPNNGMAKCTKDADCGADAFCVACTCVSASQCQKPSPDLSGIPWMAAQDLHLDEALGSFGGVMATILKDLRDGLLGCPQGSGGNCWIFEIIGQTLPQWAQTLVIAVGNFADILDNHDFLVQSQMTFMKSGKPSSYSGTDHWLMLSFHYQNMQVMEAPENVPQIGKPVIIPFNASAVCGILYVDKHKVEGVLSGILKWIVDTVIQIETCRNNGPCYMSLGDAIEGAIDCQQFLFSQPAVFAACEAFTKGLSQKIDDALNMWLLNYSLMTLQGTAQIDAVGKQLSNGHWDGTIGDGIGIFKNFNGEWSAKR